MKALVTNRWIVKQLLNLASGSSIGQCARVKDIPTPQITEDEVLVRVRAVAINPIDFKDIDFLSPNNSVTGCDYAGEVTQVGRNVASRWKVGDRIAGFVHGGQYPDIGSFAEYLKVDGELAWKIPPAVTDSEAATYGVPAVTAVLALAHLDIPWEDILNGASPKSKTPILIYSGGSNVGLFAIQLAKRAGLEVVATASPRSFDLAKGYGADSVFDYKSPTTISEISAAYPNITKALDCFSEGNSTQFCAQAMTKGRVITLLDQGKPKKSSIEYKPLMVYTVFGRPFSMLAPIGPSFPVVPNDRKILGQFYAELDQLSHDVRPPPVIATKGGFDGILEGLSKLRKGEGRGGKVVVEL
ncbi:putative zinc-binding dehydrogenase family oxidoreductase [Aspergillus cavernicola]|uniref:Zinc-binding dehydrogenase family oxidoreductase n=1 Tax=Aspergillus cavernicola TaxID=176166 RepID=A0ABR4I6K4_9EURO